MPISDAEIQALQPRSKPYKVYIAKSMSLLVMPNGNKYWRFRYQLNGKEGGYALGVYPEVSIEAARAARDAARALVRQGINPALERRKARQKATVPGSLVKLELSKNGALTIETDTHALTLSFPQSQALIAFLAVNKKNKKDSG
jgi:hypothetical protein